MQRDPVGAGEWVTAQFPKELQLRATKDQIHCSHGIACDYKDGTHGFMEANPGFTDTMLAALAASPAIIRDLVAQVKALQVALDEAEK